MDGLIQTRAAELDTGSQAYLVIIDPAAEIKSASVPTAPRLVSLEGTRIGVVDNTKHMALPMLKAVQAVLKAEFGVAAIDYFRKDNSSIPMPEQAITEMAANCDAVVHGVADCGSCITWALHDVAEFERRGRPAMTIITTAFDIAAKARSRVLGMQPVPTVAMQHPLATRGEPELQAMAVQIARQVAGILTGRQ